MPHLKIGAKKLCLLSHHPVGNKIESPRPDDQKKLRHECSLMDGWRDVEFRNRCRDDPTPTVQFAGSPEKKQWFSNRHREK